MGAMDQPHPEDRSSSRRYARLPPVSAPSRGRPEPLRTTSDPRASGARRVVATAGRASRASEQDRPIEGGLTTAGYTFSLALPTLSVAFGQPSAGVPWGPSPLLL